MLIDLFLRAEQLRGEGQHLGTLTVFQRQFLGAGNESLPEVFHRVSEYRAAASLCQAEAPPTLVSKARIAYNSMSGSQDWFTTINGGMHDQSEHTLSEQGRQPVRPR